MLSTFDLQRVSAERAAAVLVLCDKFSLDPSNTLNTHHKFQDLSYQCSILSSGGCFEYYASHFCEELQREHPVHCPAPALSQQGDHFQDAHFSDINRYFSLTYSIFLAGTGSVTTRQSVSMRLSRIFRTSFFFMEFFFLFTQVRHVGPVLSGPGVLHPGE